MSNKSAKPKSTSSSDSPNGKQVAKRSFGTDSSDMSDSTVSVGNSPNSGEDVGGNQIKSKKQKRQESVAAQAISTAQTNSSVALAPSIPLLDSPLAVVPTVVKSIILGTTKFHQLVDVITPVISLNFKIQAEGPFFVVPAHELIGQKAMVRITSRLYGRLSIGETSPENMAALPPILTLANHADWLQLCTLLEIAQFVHMLFTDSSNLTIVKSLDRALLEVPVRFSIKDEQIEEDFTIEIDRISTEFQVDKLSDKVLKKAARILFDSLERRSYLTEKMREKYIDMVEKGSMADTPLTFCMRLKIVLTQARVDVNKALVWGDPDKIHVRHHKDSKGTPTRPKVVFAPDVTVQTRPKVAFGRDVAVPGSIKPAANAQSSQRRFQENKKEPFNKCKSFVMSAVSAESTPLTLPHSDFLSVFVSLKQQIPRQPAEAINRRPLNKDTIRGSNAKVLVDTGSLAGDFISHSFLIQLHGTDYVYHKKRSITVCSGLDDHCFETNAVVDLCLVFSSELNKEIIIFITAFVSRDSKVDLILGRQTLKKHNFHKLTPSHFQNPNPDDSTNVSEDHLQLSSSIVNTAFQQTNQPSVVFLKLIGFTYF
jgi:hypothetical protein